MERPLLISARRLVMFYICAKFPEVIERYQSYRADTISIRKITEANNSAKNVSGVTIVSLCTSSCHAYISTKFCEIISNGIKVIERTRFL